LKVAVSKSKQDNILKTLFMSKSTFLKSLFCSVALLFSLQAKLQIITTVVGNGNGGYSGDGGLALNAAITSFDVKLDRLGNLYITDYQNHVIRKVTAATGIITTVAGNGTAGYSGDGGLATQAQLNNPFGCAIDSSGNIYIVDHGNFRIRKINAATGIITTIAGNGNGGISGDGGPAINANIQDPLGVALDTSENNLYITTGYVGRIRKVNLLTGIITTIAGGGYLYGDGILATNAVLNIPSAIAVDSANNIYFTEFGSYRVRKINASDGIMHTIAGNGANGYTGDGGPAKNAKIGYCQGIALDNYNNVFITDWGWNYVRKINLVDSIITTVAGTGQWGYNGDGILATGANLGQPFGIATDAKGNFYIADNVNYRTRKITIDSSVLNQIYGYAYFDLSSNNIKDSSEPLFSNGKILVKKNTDSITTFATSNFRIGVDTGTYTSSYVPFKNYYNTVPQSHTSSFSEYNQIDTVYFAMQPINGKRDLHISMFALYPPRPGFGVTYIIQYQNTGTDTITNGTIQLIKDSRFTFDSSKRTYSSINGDTIKWNYSDLKPLDTASIIVYFKVPATVNIGDTLHSVATINPVAGDLVPSDDTAAVSQITVGSFDPNNKSENHAGTISKSQVANGDYLTYIIRFQNTGTYAAFNIVVKDTLSNKLDWNTFQVVGASHNYQLEITNGNKCAWSFKAIGLPDSNTNEPASHGYIVYRIKPKNTLITGDVINNSAGIYFDYNSPVQTKVNTTTVENITLPLQLLSFSAQRNDKINLLMWSTSNEINTDRFEIERSSDSRSFLAIRTVRAISNGKTKNDYAFTDAQPLKAVNYYRLKMIDKDGKFVYSAIRSINNTSSFDVKLYPNPVKDVLTLEGLQPNTQTTISIIGLQGSVLAKATTTNSSYTWNIKQLPSGTYYVRIEADKNVSALKFVKE
jgi:uncharacterized repeat protein (TIGR01451 family)